MDEDQQSLPPPQCDSNRPALAAPRLSQPGDLVLLLSGDQKRYLLRLQPHQRFHCHLGHLTHDELVGVPFGSTVYSQLGHPLLLLDPGLSDLMTRLKRGTQIIYPKDAAYLVHRLSLHAGRQVVEAGTGSASLTTALAWAIAPTGRVFTYESRPELFNLARNNLERTGMLPYVEMHQRTIADGFLQSEVDALFLDVRDPWLFLPQALAALRPGGFFASLLPTTNQVSQLLATMDRFGFADVAVEELLLRRYKPAPDRLRPDDNMIGHTGFLIFARRVAGDDATHWRAPERKRYAARVQAAAASSAAAVERAEERAAGGRKYPRLPLPG